MSTKWYFTNDKPIYSQIVERVKQLIVSGELKPGDKLAGVRDLAVEAEVNHNTMQRALSELERTGLIYSQRTSGRFVTENRELISSAKEEIANERIIGFLQSMMQLGYTKEQITQLLKIYKEV